MAKVSGRQILDAAGLHDEPVRVPHPDQKTFPNATVLHPVIVAYMGRRSHAFAEATSRPPGKAMVYGATQKDKGHAAR